jgi:hypothetical protein
MVNHHILKSSERVKKMKVKTPMRPMEEIQRKFKRLKRNTKYLFVAFEEDGRVLLRHKDIHILVNIPRCVSSLIPTVPFHSNLYLIRSEGMVRWGIEHKK